MTSFYYRALFVENYIAQHEKLADFVYKWEGWVRTSRSQAKDIRFLFRVSVVIKVKLIIFI